MDKRVILIVLDSAGIGALPDAGDFGDEGCNTLGHIQTLRPMNIPHMRALGLGHIQGSLIPKAQTLIGSYCKCAERTKAKDTTCGHWEMAGLPMDTPFRTYPDGFPKEVMDAFEQAIGRGTLGNCVASGTEIIQRLGDEHVKTGKPIVYTSADSVFQIAAHEDIIPLQELYRCCEIARAQLVGDNLVGRVIARPFIGGNGVYTRTENRKDYAIAPFEDTVLDALQAESKQTVAIGKIEDIFCKRGIDVIDHSKNNLQGIEATLKAVKSGKGSFIFTNLVDTDMLYGHRRDVEGYAKALEYFDSRLPEIMEAMGEEDILMVTADHGCDPAFKGTDHTREYIPLLVYGKKLKAGVDLGVRDSFCDIAATAYAYLTDKSWKNGSSFLNELL